MVNCTKKRQLQQNDLRKEVIIPISDAILPERIFSRRSSCSTLGSDMTSDGIFPVKMLPPKLNNQKSSKLLHCESTHIPRTSIFSPFILPDLWNRPSSEGIVPISWFLKRLRYSCRERETCSEVTTLARNIIHVAASSRSIPRFDNSPNSVGIVP